MATKYIIKSDAKLGNRLVAQGTVFYKNESGSYSPWFNRKVGYFFADELFVSEIV